MRVVSNGQLCFAVATLCLGILGLVYGDFALVWQEVPKWVPGRQILAYLCAVFMLACGAGLFWRRTAPRAARLLLVYLLLWLLLLRVPNILTAPAVENSWAGCAETAVYLAGGWVLFARFNGSGGRGILAFASGERGVRAARLLYGLALLPCGLAHLVYAQPTADFIPAWVPWHLLWVYLTGTAFLAAGVAIVFSVCARLAAILSAAMMGLFTLLVWLPQVSATPSDRFRWTGLLISLALTAGGWVVADSTAAATPLAVSQAPQ